MKKSIGEQLAALPPHQRDLFPDIKVELEPVFEVMTPAPDMAPIAEALKQISIPEPNIDVHNHFPPRKPKTVKIDIERDGRGYIKSLVCTEIVNV